MTSVGKCLEGIQIEMSFIPRELKTDIDKSKALKSIMKVREFMITLGKLVLDKNFRQVLSRLEKVSEGKVRKSAEELDEILKDLEHALYITNLYILELLEIVTERPNDWNKKAPYLVLMIDQKFCSDRGDLRQEFEYALHEEEELRQLLSSSQRELLGQ